MKIKATLLAALSLCAYSSQVLADDDKDTKKKEDKQEHKDHDHDDHEGHDHGDHDHDHDHDKIIAGPNGGRVLTSVEPHLEFFVQDDRTVKITALDEDLKPIKVDKQSVKIVAGDRKKPTRLKFEEKDGVLISDAKLPEGNLYPVIVQIKTAKLKKSVNEKFNLNLTQCSSCDNKEYACTCDHDHAGEEKGKEDSHEGHDHADHEGHDH